MTDNFQCSYIHLRKFNERNELENFGGATIAYTVHRMGDSLLVEFSVAECCDKDRFEKARGRSISAARLKNKKLFSSFQVSNTLIDEIEKKMIDAYLDYKGEYVLGAQDIYETVRPF